ncbi:MAG: hypothetical protein J0H74_20390 [Chitinophagaceae bacterium]|nr:hypothetical protein [Chitinophagaceae bacterium]
MELFLRIILILHIIGGFFALISGAIAMLTRKGGRIHRRNGKIYFVCMTVVFVSAVILSTAHHIPFLLMVGFFSYYMVVRGYRILYLKNLGRGQRPAVLDWTIVLLAGGFIICLLGWGIVHAIRGPGMGYVAIVFGGLGSSFLAGDVRKFLRPSTEKMHWWYTHIAGMCGGYIATVTAFVVVNVQMNPGWVPWLLPTAIGGPLIARTITKYKKRFAEREG